MKTVAVKMIKKPTDIKHRIQSYFDLHKEIFKYYQADKFPVYHIDASGSAEEVYQSCKTLVCEAKIIL